MYQNPWAFPPGPERRKLMAEQFKNFSPDDFTIEEWSDIQERAANRVDLRLDERRP